VAVASRTRSGLLKFRPANRGSRVALVAPASAFDRYEFDAGVAELRRLGFEPVWDDSIFERGKMTAGSAARRAASLMRAFTSMEADAVIAIRGGYGSAELLPRLDLQAIRDARVACVGYSDLTSLQVALASIGLASVHGAMLDRRLSKGAPAYDERSFLTSLSCEPLGEISGAATKAIGGGGEVSGPFCGGTLTQLQASLATPFEFAPPPHHVHFIDEINERPYRLHRMLTQFRQAGRLRQTAAIVFGELPGCDEPNGSPTAIDAIRDVLDGFTGPILAGFPAGHTVTPLVSVPLGVQVRVVAAGTRAGVVFEEAAAG
jgi:muramoyltetrapeptide carboxypeptidase